MLTHIHVRIDPFSVTPAPNLDRSIRRRIVGVAAGFLVALACVALVVSHSDGRTELVQGVKDQNSKGREQALVYGRNWFQNNGWGSHLNHHWWGCPHYFRSLCHYHTNHPSSWYQDPANKWWNRHDWLDYSDKLHQAHDADDERQVAFHEATQELHDKVLEDRKDREKEREDIKKAREADLKEIKEQMQQERDETAERVLEYQDQRDQRWEKANNDFVAKIEQTSGGQDEYKELFEDAKQADLERRETFHRLIGDMETSGAKDEDIKDAKLAFEKQEHAFQLQLNEVSARVDHMAKSHLTPSAKPPPGKDRAEHVPTASQDATKAEEALHKFAQQVSQREEKMEQETIAKEKEQSNTEKAAARAAAKALDQKKAEFAEKDNSYSQTLNAAESAEEKRVSSFEKKVQTLKAEEHARDKQRQQELRREEAQHDVEIVKEHKLAGEHARAAQLSRERQEEVTAKSAEAARKTAEATEEQAHFQAMQAEDAARDAEIARKHKEEALSSRKEELQRKEEEEEGLQDAARQAASALKEHEPAAAVSTVAHVDVSTAASLVGSQAPRKPATTATKGAAEAGALAAGKTAGRAAAKPAVTTVAPTQPATTATKVAAKAVGKTAGSLTGKPAQT